MVRQTAVFSSFFCSLCHRCRLYWLPNQHLCAKAWHVQLQCLRSRHLHVQLHQCALHSVPVPSPSSSTSTTLATPTTHQPPSTFATPQSPAANLPTPAASYWPPQGVGSSSLMHACLSCNSSTEGPMSGANDPERNWVGTQLLWGWACFILQVL